VLYLFLLLVVVAAWRELRPAAVGRRRQAALEVLDPGRARLVSGERIGVVSGATVGRTVGNSIRLEEDSISSRHAVLRFEGGRWWVEDLQSTNGTYVNESRVTGRSPLHPGDVVQFGLVTARFQT
jgi:pSer/pThr/pTyr-binding forkhead associated (FHA) protein